MSSPSCSDAVLTRKEHFEGLLDELSELAGQRNAIDARIVEIVAEIDLDGLWGNTGCRSVSALVAWKLGTSSANAETIAAIAHRLPQFPRCAAGMREGRLSLDQVGVIAKKAADGSDDHYAQLASVATVSQLNNAVKLEPRPDPAPEPEPAPRVTITKTSDQQFTTWKIRLPHAESATMDAALQSHHDALIAEWKRTHTTADTDNTDTDTDADADADGHDAGRGAGDTGGHGAGGGGVAVPPFPTRGDAFMSLVETGWDADVAARPHGQRSTVVVHLDVDHQLAQWHLGPLLSEADRRSLLCDATCEVWFERDGQPIGAGRSTRLINRRLRRALEYRNPTCAVPGCGARRGLHAHHIVHWEDGGATELSNLVLVCPYHHRLHHNGAITITGPAHQLTVTDSQGRKLSSRSLARPPTKPPPTVAPYPGPLGERADWWWYTPFQPQPPPTPN